jgi:hypothetical protein
VEAVERVHPAGLDPCHNSGSFWHAAERLTEEQDSLDARWDWVTLAHGGQIVLNPPWANMLPFVERLCEAVQRGASATLIGPSSTATRWWQLAARACQVRCELADRVAYYRDGERDPRPRECTTLFYFGPAPGRFAAVFTSRGVISRQVPAEVYSASVAALLQEESAARQVVLPEAAPPKEKPVLCLLCGERQERFALLAVHYGKAHKHDSRGTYAEIFAYGTTYQTFDGWYKIAQVKRALGVSESDTLEIRGVAVEEGPIEISGRVTTEISWASRPREGQREIRG